MLPYFHLLLINFNLIQWFFFFFLFIAVAADTCVTTTTSAITHRHVAVANIILLLLLRDTRPTVIGRGRAHCARTRFASVTRARFRRRENRMWRGGPVCIHRTRACHRRHRFHRPRHYTTCEKLKTIQNIACRRRLL
uniref:Uncharacterized protein n=1 Tax=Schizaphis graminum TaxID=13262 RepID=A0A2S2NYU6_SCHGA